MSDTTFTDYHLEQQAGYLLRLATQRHVAIFTEIIPYGLTPPQFSVMMRLGAIGRASQNHLGRQVNLDVATIKGVIDRLVGKGFVLAEPDPADARRRLLRLTDDGLSVLDELASKGLRITEETVKFLDEGERKQLLVLLRKLSGEENAR